MQQKNMCKCPHHKTMPLLVVLFGLVFLLQALDVLGSGIVMIVWPIIVMLAGLMKLMESKCTCC